MKVLSSKEFRLPHPEQPGRTGVFLVRKSSKTEHKFVLSCYTQNQLQHIPIIQHGVDSFYSLDGKNVFHGLDELIKFYQKNDKESDVSLKSFSFVKDKILPFGFRKTGHKNFLHNAVIENNLRVVEETVKSSTFLDFKDGEGKTALHYACLAENINLRILELLIENGDSLMTRDWTGKIPFMYACELGRKEIVEMMIAKDNDVIMVRNSVTHDVALHGAAKAGQKNIVKLLLAHNAALTPKNKEGKFPIDLAADERREEIVLILSRHRPTVKIFDSNLIHENLTRKQAQTLLIKERERLRQLLPVDEKFVSGLFLVRFSETTSLNVISMLEGDNIKNFKICQGVSHTDE